MAHITKTRGSRHSHWHTFASFLLIGSLLNITPRAAHAQTSEPPLPTPVQNDAPTTEPPPPTPVQDDVTTTDDSTVPHTTHAIALADETRVCDGETIIGRDAFSRTVCYADGSRAVQVRQRPMHWWDAAAAQWANFDNILTPASGADVSADDAIESRGNGYRVRFGTADAMRGGRASVRYAVGAASIELTAVDAKPKDAIIAGTTVTYPEAYPGVDLRYTVDNERVKEDLILTSPPAAPPSFRWILKLDGVEAVLEADQGIRFVDTAGVTQFSMPPPFMLDSNAQADAAERWSTAIAVSLTEQGSKKLELTYTPDAAWLADPARVYPIILDPSLKRTEYEPIGSDGKNVTVKQSAPTTNYNANPSLFVGKNSSGQRDDVLIQFPALGQLPQDTAITFARLEMEAVSGTSAMPVEATAATATWSATTATWNNAPASGSTVWATTAAAIGGTQPGNTWNITSLVRSWVRGETAQYGLRLRSAGSNNQSVRFHSSYYSDNTCFNCQPELYIRYVPVTRAGLNRLYTYTTQDYGGGNTGSVNLSTGNFVLQHRGGSVAARGFTLDLTHTYNSQSPYPEQSYTGPETRDAFYGEGWSFQWDWRLLDYDSGSAVQLRDGTGDGGRVFIKQADSGGTRSYLRPLNYDYTLTKDISTTPDPSRVYTLLADQGAMRYFFDNDGKLRRIEDRNGNFLTYGYDSNDRIATITDVAGRTTRFEYNGVRGRLSKITDMAGQVSTYSYTSAAQLDSVTHAVGTPDAATTRFVYSDAHQMERVINPRGRTSRIAYQFLNRWATTNSLENWSAATTSQASVSYSTQQVYDGSGALKADLTNASFAAPAKIQRLYSTPTVFGSVTNDVLAWVYLPAGAPTVIAELGLTYQRNEDRTSENTLQAGQWNSVWLRDAQIDPSAPVKSITLSFYTPSGAAAYTGAVWIDELQIEGVTESLTDAKPTPNTLARYSYAWNTLTTTVARPDQGGTFRNTTYLHNRSGQVVKVTDPLNNVTDSAFDDQLRLTSVTLPGGTASTYNYSHYPNSNELQTATSELNEVSRRGAEVTNGDTRYSIDPLNDTRRSGNQAYEATVFNRDAAGNINSAQTNRYAAGANLEQSTLPTAQTVLRNTRFTYHAGGLLDRMTDARNNYTEFDYQSSNTGYLTQISAPPGTGESTRRITTITPNSNGSIQNTLDARGLTTSYTYDGLRRLRSITYGAGTSNAFTISYTLDANGNMTAMSDASGSTAWTYDENNQPLTEARTQNGATKTASYAYYNNGALKTITTFDGQTSTLGYDAAGRLTTQTDPNDGGRTISYGYDSRSRRTTITYPSGIKQQTGYDKAGRADLITLKTSGGTTLESFDYEYGFDSAGTRTSSYRKGFVTKVTELGGAMVTYGYDDLDRLTSATRTGSSPYTQTYGYDLVNNRTSFVNSGTTTGASYDAANQMTTLGGVNYTYDHNGNMTGYGANVLSYDAANKWVSGTVNSTALAFGYDGFGRRTHSTAAANRTDLWYDRTGLTEQTGATGITFLRDPGGLLLSRSGGSGTHNYGRDRLGSITTLTTTAGATANTYTYDPYGTQIASSGTVPNPFRYTAGYLDDTTGLYLFGQRFYQPGAGRFTQLDPLPKNIATPNRFAYAGCNPANATDPTGLSDCVVEGLSFASNVGLYASAVIASAVGVATAPTGFGALIATAGITAIVFTGVGVASSAIAFERCRQGQ